MSGFPSVCKDCEERKVGCHSTCKKYIEVKKEYSDRKENVMSQSRGHREVSALRIESIEKLRKRQRDRRRRG